MRTCVLAHTETLPANKITKKIREKQRWPSQTKKGKNIRTVPMRTCVHVHTLKEITALASDPNDLNLLRNKMEVENKLELTRFELNDVVEVKTTAEEAMAFSNSWRTYRKRTDRLVCSRGKVYSLVLGQCTTVLLDKMKQDSNWQTVSDSYDPLKLLKLIEKYILKQSDNQYNFLFFFLLKESNSTR